MIGVGYFRVRTPEAGERAMSERNWLIDTAGRRITGSDVRRGLACNIVSGACAQVWMASAAGMPLTMLLLALGANRQEQNLPAAIGHLVLCMQLFGALAAERLPTRKYFWFTSSFLHRFLWLIPAVLSFFLRGPSRLAVWMVLAMLLVSGALAQFGNAAWHSWMADLVPAAQRGRFWGRRHVICMCVLLVGYLGSGWMLDRLHAPGPPTVVALAAAPANEAPPSPAATAASGTPKADTNANTPVAAATSAAMAEDSGWWTRRPFVAFAVVFAIGAVLGMTDIVLHLMVPEPAPAPRPARASPLKRFVAPLRHRDFRLLTLAMGAWYFGLGVVGAFAAVFLRERCGASNFEISLTSMAGALGAIPCGFLGAYLADRMGARIFGAVMMIITVLAMSVWFFLPQGDWTVALPGLEPATVSAAVVVVIIASFATGGAASGVTLAQLSLLGEHAPREGRTMAMAVHWTTVGFLAVPGALLGGWVAKQVDLHPLDWTLPTGTPVEYIQVLTALQIVVALAVAVPLLLRVRGRGSELGLAEALGRIVIVNPMRLVGSVYNIHALGSPARRRDQRAKAVRNLASLRTHVAAVDLIRRLDDPSADVREAATFALSRIGGAEAVDALMAKLADPDSDLSAHAVRALREINDPRVVPALIAVLERSNDPETRAQAARALGRMRDARAAAPLFKVLKDAGAPLHFSGPTAAGDGSVSSSSAPRAMRNQKLFASAAEALARLGETSALAEILPWMRRLPDTVRKRGLAVAAGDLLGRREEFYMLYAAEEEAPGREVERRCARLAAALDYEEARARGWRGRRQPAGASATGAGAGEGGAFSDFRERFPAAYEAGDHSAAALLLREALRRLARARWAPAGASDRDGGAAASAAAVAPGQSTDAGAGTGTGTSDTGTGAGVPDADEWSLNVWSERGERARWGAWYLEKLARPDADMNPPDRAEILLGLFFLCDWAEN